MMIASIGVYGQRDALNGIQNGEENGEIETPENLLKLENDKQLNSNIEKSSHAKQQEILYLTKTNNFLKRFNF